MEGLEGVCVCVCAAGETVLIDTLLPYDEWKTVNAPGPVMDEMLTARCPLYLRKLVNPILLNAE